MRRFIAVPVLVFCLIAAGCSSDSDGSTSDSTSTTMEAETTTTTAAYPGTKVMFVGNSFTFHRGGLPKQISDLAAAATPPLETETHESTIGGATLEFHWGFSTPVKIETGNYDIVVLQGDIPESDVDSFQEAARNLVDVARQTGAEPVLYMAWPYERLGWITMDEIAQAHTDIATELDVNVAPVGLAFERALSERPELDMLSSDNEHQSTHGAHLAAYVIYLTIFGTEAPDTVTDLIEGDPITEEDVKFLHRIARETVNQYAADQAS